MRKSPHPHPTDPMDVIRNQDLPGNLVATSIRARIEKMQAALVGALGNLQTARWLAADDTETPLRQLYERCFSIDEQEHLDVSLARLADALEELYWLQLLPPHVQDIVAPDDDEEEALVAAGRPSRPPDETEDGA